MGGRRFSLWQRGVVVGTVLGLAWFGFAPASGAARTKPHSHSGPSVVIDVQSTSTYGPILVASFTGAGFPLYEITSDRPPTFGCTTTKATTFMGPLACTGPETFTTGPTSSEWPALTTTGRPIAGPGVSKQLLSVVTRPGIGRQVIYGGHPLYLFSGPTTFFGQGFLETDLPLPPWHGLWNLVSANKGVPAPGPAVIEGGQILTRPPVLSVEEYPFAVTGGVAATVYDFCSNPVPAVPSASTCPPATPPRTPRGVSKNLRSSHLPVPSTTPNWIPVLTQGSPRAGTGADQTDLGTISTAQGTQVTYEGHPLFLYSSEQALFETGGPVTTGTEGNGVGVSGPGGIAHRIALDIP